MVFFSDIGWMPDAGDYQKGYFCMTLEELEQRQNELDARLTRAEDLEAIKKMTYEYFNCLTLGQTGNMSQFFCEDGEFELPRGTIKGKEKLEEYFADLSLWHTGAESQMLMHPIIEVNGDKATGKWMIYFVNTYYLTAQPLFVTASMYDNEYIKINGEWKFKRVHWIMRFGPPGKAPFPGCHGLKQFEESQLRTLETPLKQARENN